MGGQLTVARKTPSFDWEASEIEYKLRRVERREKHANHREATALPDAHLYAHSMHDLQKLLSQPTATDFVRACSRH